jgi:hypothetical protein
MLRAAACLLLIRARLLRVQQRQLQPPRAPACEKRHSFFEFSLCLTRACLGKMFVFIYKWRKKMSFSAPDQRIDRPKACRSVVERHHVSRSIHLRKR